MVTFYSTTRYWEVDASDITDVSLMSEDKLFELICNNPHGLIKVEPHVNDSAFKRLFLRCTPEGYIAEGVYSTVIKGHNINYRLLDNINAILSRGTKAHG